MLKTKIQSKPGYFWYFFGGKVDRAKIDGDVQTLTAYYRVAGLFPGPRQPRRSTMTMPASG